MTNTLQHLGHSVEIATLDSQNATWLAKFPVKMHVFGPSFWRYCFNTKLVPWLRANADKYDALIVHGIWQYHSFATWRSVRKSKVPYYVYTHGMLDPWFKREYPLKHLKKWAYWPWAEYRVLRDAKAVIFTGNEEQRLAKESFWLYRSNGVVVNFGITGPVGNSSSQVENFYSTFPHLYNKRLCLYLSRIHFKKGCDILIQAFANVCRNDNALHLVIAGPDQDGWRAKLEKLANSLDISDRITWAGMLSEDLKWGAFRTAEVFILPSHSENFGAVVAEALSCGLPVLISNKVNIWREILDYQAGLVESDDLQGTIRLFENWLNMSQAEKLEMQFQSRKCYLDNFDIKVYVENLIRAITPGSSITGSGDVSA